MYPSLEQALAQVGPTAMGGGAPGAGAGGRRARVGREFVREVCGRWGLGGLADSAALPAARDPLLDTVDLHGAHDLRHTYATWLEDAGIPARVIDELMGHEATTRSGQHRGSAMGAYYRHTTSETAVRVVDAVQQH
jgi:integrase